MIHSIVLCLIPWWRCVCEQTGIVSQENDGKSSTESLPVKFIAFTRFPKIWIVTSMRNSKWISLCTGIFTNWGIIWSFFWRVYFSCRPSRVPANYLFPGHSMHWCNGSCENVIKALNCIYITSDFVRKKISKSPQWPLVVLYNQFILFVIALIRLEVPQKIQESNEPHK